MRVLNKFQVFRYQKTAKLEKFFEFLKFERYAKSSKPQEIDTSGGRKLYFVKKGTLKIEREIEVEQTNFWPVVSCSNPSPTSAGRCPRPPRSEKSSLRT